MRQELYIGECPANESCAQVGAPDYYPRAIKECRTYIKQLRRIFGEEPLGARLKIGSSDHDFGRYHYVAVEFETESKEAVEWAYKIENNSPGEWDDESRAELGIGLSE
jgi:hypothetical protein